jgi:FAD dependent oxidoreductase TIGR03364
MSLRSADIAIIGGGIVGLAHAYVALRRGYKVILFEREQFAVGASVRNFGLLWPIGQEPGPGLDRATRSRQHWIDVSREAGIWLHENGSLHLAYHDDELAVLNEFTKLYSNQGFATKLLTPNQVSLQSRAARAHGLKGALWSGTECTVNPREAVRRIPLWLKEKYGLQLEFGKAISHIRMPVVSSGDEEWNVDKVLICSGADFETLYPQDYREAGLKKCKLQMMKIATDHPGFELGPSLCAGLTLRHYNAFSRCPSLAAVDKRYDALSPGFKEHGIHVLLSQNNYGELIIGDSHHYDKSVEPFDQEEINKLILEYFTTFADPGPFRIIERWHGVYPKSPSELSIHLQPEPGVHIINGLGGAGMTLSFGLAEEIINSL